jgi:hypothetical protein
MAWMPAKKLDLTQPGVVVVPMDNDDGRTGACHIRDAVLEEFGLSVGKALPANWSSRDRENLFRAIEQQIVDAARDKLKHLPAAKQGAIALEPEDIGRPAQVDTSIANDPGQLRARAAEARAVARSLSDPGAKEDACEIARRFDRLAMQARPGR